MLNNISITVFKYRHFPSNPLQFFISRIGQIPLGEGYIHVAPVKPKYLNHQEQVDQLSALEIKGGHH
mgnify:CR=1 FL=1